jgi:hypothetical protein
VRRIVMRIFKKEITQCLRCPMQVKAVAETSSVGEFDVCLETGKILPARKMNPAGSSSADRVIFTPDWCPLPEIPYEGSEMHQARDKKEFDPLMDALMGKGRGQSSQ